MSVPANDNWPSRTERVLWWAIRGLWLTYAIALAALIAVLLEAFQ